ncbi:MAG: hypothetical protein AAGG11_17510 [Pseudomonadota bacterium]
MTVADINIDEFFRDAARALLSLYDAFPRPIILYVEDLNGPDETDEFGLHSPRHLACYEALLWLGAEGYLRFADAIKQEALDQAVLSERAFLMLNRRPPDSDQRHLTRLRDALKARSSTQLETAMLAFMES